MGRRLSQIKADKVFFAGKVHTPGLFVKVFIPEIQKICVHLRPIMSWPLTKHPAHPGAGNFVDGKKAEGPEDNQN